MTDDDDDDSLSKIGVEWQKRSPIDSVTVAPPRIAYEEVEAEEEFEEEFDEDDFEMIQDIFEDQIKNNSAITAQQIIWREKNVEIEQAEESVTDDDDDDSLSHLLISNEQKELNNFVKNGNNLSMDLFGNVDPTNTNQYEFDLSEI